MNLRTCEMPPALVPAFFHTHTHTHAHTQLREKVRQTVEAVVRSTVASEAEVDSILCSPAEPKDFDCLEAVVGAFSDQCFKLGQVGLGGGGGGNGWLTEQEADSSEYLRP